MERYVRTPDNDIRKATAHHRTIGSWVRWFQNANRKRVGVSNARRAAIIRAGLLLSPLVDRALVHWSRLDDQPVYDAHAFAWRPALEAAWPEIRAEADAVLGDPGAAPPLCLISPDHARIATDERWKSFFLWGYGVREDANCARCPRTAALLERVPGLLTALFSILEPGARIPPHTGASKAILTCHMGLRVAAEYQRCGMRVDGTVLHWQEGRMLVFDDMYEHEAWNDSDEYRVNLMLHVARPERFPGTLVRDAFVAAVRRSPFVQDARRNVVAWRKGERQLRPPRTPKQARRA